MLRVVTNKDGIRFDYDSLAKRLEVENYLEWRLSKVSEFSEQLGVPPTFVAVDTESCSDESVIKQFLSISMKGTNLTRILVQKFIGPLPLNKEPDEQTTWLNQLIVHLSSSVLRSVFERDFWGKIVSLHQDCELKFDKLPKFENWINFLTEKLSRTALPGQCNYPTCRKLIIPFRCELCPAGFCSQTHQNQASEKGYHKH